MHYTPREVKVALEAAVRTPVSIVLVNAYDIVVMGIAHILEQYRDRVVVADLDIIRKSITHVIVDLGVVMKPHARRCSGGRGAVLSAPRNVTISAGGEVRSRAHGAKLLARSRASTKVAAEDHGRLRGGRA